MKAPKPKILILGSDLDYIDKQYYSQFKADYDVDVLDAKDRAETISKLPTQIHNHGPYRALVVKMGTIPYEPYDAALLHPLTPDCDLVVSASAGYNEFDVAWMSAQGITFCNTVAAVAEATADMALFLLLAAVRNTSNAERQARAGGWRAGLTPTRDPNGMVLGVVGLGAIGRLVARKARVFGLRVWYFQRRRAEREEEERLGVRWCGSLRELLQGSDVVSLHVPLNAATEGLMGREQFAWMREGSFLVNTARGAVVDEGAMVGALESGKLARVGLDVFTQEPEISEYLRTSDKVVLQPHMGGLTESAFAKSQLECLENIRAYFEKGTPNSPVNHPKR